LPERADPPFFHKVGFSVDSLLGEYVDDVYALRNGEVVCVPALEELECLEFADLGSLEAVTTSGGTGTAPYALPSGLKDYEYKTLRFPGHWAAMTFMRDGGFWSEEMLPGGVSPRAVSLTLMERAMVDPDYRDVVVTRVIAEGPGGSKSYDVVDRYDPVTGFTAMQRTTGFSTAIVALEVAAGRVEPGCRACELAVNQSRFFEEAAKRGIFVTPS
jgi:lysine 6-dehydrogenase